MLPCFKALLLIPGHFPPSPLGTTAIGADQREWLLWINGTPRNLFI